MKKFLMLCSAMIVAFGGEASLLASSAQGAAVMAEQQPAEQTVIGAENEGEEAASSTEVENEPAEEEEASVDEVQADETQAEEEITNEHTIGTLSVEQTIVDGPYTFYLNDDETIKYSSYTENGKITKYTQYYDGAKYVQNSPKRVYLEMMMNTSDNTINHTREYDRNGNWIKAFEYPTNMKVDQNLKYWQGSNHMYIMQPNRKDGMLSYGTKYTRAGKQERHWQYQAGTRYGSDMAKNVQYEAFMNTSNETINHVREYDTRANWIKAFEYPGNTKINQNIKYWRGAVYMFIMHPNRKDGMVKYEAAYTKEGKAHRYWHFRDGAYYGVNLSSKVDLEAFMNTWNDTINHTREYDDRGNWTKVFEYPSNTRIDQNIPYWHKRLYTFYMRPNRKDGLVDYSIQWSAPGNGDAVRRHNYHDNTFYGTRLDLKVRETIEYKQARWEMPVKTGVVYCILEKCMDGDYGGRHNGTDISNNGGAAVYSMNRGTVTVASAQGSLGNTVGIRYHVDGRDFYIVYAHLREIHVGVGQNVDVGQQIGIVGNTGGPWAEHLHVEVQVDTNYFIGNPEQRKEKSVGLDWIFGPDSVYIGKWV